MSFFVELKRRNVIRVAVAYLLLGWAVLQGADFLLDLSGGKASASTCRRSAKCYEIGKGRIIREGTKVAILSLGTRLAEAVKAAEMLDTHGLSTTVADARFAKPLDHDLIRQLARHDEVVVTIEEGSRGGFGAWVLHFMAEDGLLDRGLKVRTMTLPDRYHDHNSPAKIYEEARLNAPHIVETVMRALRRSAEVIKLRG